MMTNILRKTAVIVLALCFSASALETATKSDSKEKDPAEVLFQKAEDDYVNGEHAHALKEYLDYMYKYPEYPAAPAALFRIGAIYASRANNERARNSYMEIVKSYPQGPYYREAMVEIMASFYRDKKYSDVVNFGKTVPDNLKPEDYLVRKYTLMGDSYMSLNKYFDSADSYLNVLPYLDKDENRETINKFYQAASKLKIKELTALLLRIKDMEIKGDITYRLCQNTLKEGNKDRSVEALTKFIEQFPKDRNYAEAVKQRDALLSSPFDVKLIGCLLPTSGKYGALGSQAQKGFDQAFRKFSTSSGYNGLKVVYKDTESDPQKTVEAVDELAGLGVCAIIGPVGTVEEAAKEAQKRGVPIFTLTGKDDITKIGDFVFRNFLTPKMQMKSLVTYSMDTLGFNRFAILYPEEQYGKDMMNLFWDEVKLKGGRINGVESYSSKTNDFTRQIKKLTGLYFRRTDEYDRSGEKDAGENERLSVYGEKGAKQPIIDFDAVFIPDEGERVGAILNQLSYQNVKNVYLLGTNLWHTNRLIEKSGKKFHRAIIPDGFYAESRNPVVQQFVKSFKDYYGETPGFLEAVTYDSTLMVFETIKKGALSYKEFRDNLKKIKGFKGVTGTTAIDPSGDVVKSVYLLQADSTGFKELAR